MIYMSEEEIVRRYQQAEGTAERKTQIKILAELNAVDTREIREILQKHGIKVPKVPGPKKAEPAKSEAEKIDAVQKIPTAVFNACMIQITTLEAQISELDKKAKAIQDAKNEALADLQDLKIYIGMEN